MSSITLSVDVERTSLVCHWTLVGNTHFDTITGQVLTYTDLSGNAWINQQVSVSDTPDEYHEIINGLDASTDYKVYVTVIGKKTVGGVTSRVVKTSNVVYKTTGAIRANPDFTLLSGKDYLQVVFWEPGQIPTTTYGQPAAVAYNFLTSDIKSFIISVNNLTTQDAAEEAGTSLRSFEATDVKTYEVIDPNGYTYTYKYILIENLQESSSYEVAVTYMTEVDILPILALSATKIQETKDSVGEGRAASYALNTLDASGNVGVNISIDVVWRAPETKVVDDTQADIPPTSSSIQRQVKIGETWTDDGDPVDRNQLQLAAMQDANGNYKYVDTSMGAGIIGKLVRYNIDLKNADGTVIVSTQTNEMRTLKKISATLTASQIKLDTSTGDVWFESSMFTLFNFGTLGAGVLGGFDNDEFVNRGSLNNQFRLKYTIDGVVAYKPITLNPANGNASSITNKIARVGEKSITVAVELNPSHETGHYPTAVSEQYTAVSRSLLTTNGVTLYNTTLPGQVNNFVYTNTEASDADQGSNKIRLTWSSTDSASNPNADVFYTATITDYDAETSYIAVLAPPGVTLTALPQSFNTTANYTGTTDLSYEFTRTIGHAYTATIQRVYIYNTVTVVDNANVVGSFSNGYFLNGPLNTGGQELIQFLNPPEPTVTTHRFADNVLSFNLSHAAGTYGFTDDETNFEVTLTNASDALQDITLQAGTGTNGAGANSINMAGIGAMGDSFTLHVRAYVTTKHKSDSTVPKNFYSTEHTFTFRKLTPLAAPTDVISSKFVDNSSDMKIEWTKVTNAVAASFSPAATIYYILEVIGSDSNSEIITLLSSDHMNSDLTIPNTERRAILFGTNTPPANRDIYDEDTANSFSYIYTGCTPGVSYTYSITARYFARDIQDFVSSDPTETGRPLLAFGALPTPVALIDVQSEGTKFNFEMAHNDINASGVGDGDLTFEYVILDTDTQDPVGSPADLSVGENPNVLVSGFSGIQKGDIIPVGFRTYYNAYATSDDEVTTKYISDIVSNFDVNPVKFTYLPQVKTINVTYVNGDCLIAVTYEMNGNKFGELHAVTQWLDTSDDPHLNGVHDLDTTDNHTAEERNDDHTYTLTLSDVKVSGLTFVSLAGHVARGLVVAHMTTNTGLIAGTYVPEALYSANFVIQA